MKTIFILASVLVVACSVERPPIVKPPVYQDPAGGTCNSACENMVKLLCIDAGALVKCEQFCNKVTSSGYLSLELGCVTNAVDLEDLNGCGVQCRTAL